jgi:hypothetical protein
MRVAEVWSRIKRYRYTNSSLGRYKVPFHCRLLYLYALKDEEESIRAQYSFSPSVMFFCHSENRQRIINTICRFYDKIGIRIRKYDIRIHKGATYLDKCWPNKIFKGKQTRKCLEHYVPVRYPNSTVRVCLQTESTTNKKKCHLEQLQLVWIL